MAVSKSKTGYSDYTVSVINRKIEQALKELKNSKLPQLSGDQYSDFVLNIVAHRIIFSKIKPTTNYSIAEARAIVLQHLIESTDSVYAKIDDIITQNLNNYRVNCSLPIVPSSETHSIKIGNNIYGASLQASKSNHCSLVEDCIPAVEQEMLQMVYEMIRSVPNPAQELDSLKSAIRQRLSREETCRISWVPIYPGTTTPGTATLIFSSQESFREYLVRKSLNGAIERAIDKLAKKIEALQAQDQQ